MATVPVIPITFVVLKNCATATIAANSVAICRVGRVEHDIVLHQTALVTIPDAHGVLAHVVDDIVADDQV